MQYAVLYKSEAENNNPGNYETQSIKKQQSLCYTPTKTTEASTAPLALQGGYQHSVQKAPECSGAE